VLDLTVRGGAPYGMPGVLVDSHDIEAMAKVTLEAARRARAGEGPTFIEARTYRFRGHSMSDPMKYRTKEELENAKKNDPIIAYQAILMERGWIDEPTLHRITDEVKQEVEECIAFAEESPETPLDSLYEDITVAPFIPQE